MLLKWDAIKGFERLCLIICISLIFLYLLSLLLKTLKKYPQLISTFFSLVAY